MKLELNSRSNLLLLGGVVFSVISIVCLYNFKTPWYEKPHIWYDDDLHTRGLIHFETMEHGMKPSCWNNTGKKYLQLVCSILKPNSDLEVELAFFITSCFCESIGSVPLNCKLTGGASDGNRLAKCAKGKCHNQYGHDSFHTIYTRMTDLCHYYLQTFGTNQKLKPALSQYDLEDMIFEAGGGSSGRPNLKHLKRLVDDEIKSRNAEYKSSWKYYLDDFLMAFEDLGYNLGIVTYDYNH